MCTSYLWWVTDVYSLTPTSFARTGLFKLTRTLVVTEQDNMRDSSNWYSEQSEIHIGNSRIHVGMGRKCLKKLHYMSYFLLHARTMSFVLCVEAFFSLRFAPIRNVWLRTKGQLHYIIGMLCWVSGGVGERARPYCYIRGLTHTPQGFQCCSHAIILAQSVTILGCIFATLLCSSRNSSVLQ